MEFAVEFWNNSFIGSLPHQSPSLSLLTIRNGNVIGGGDCSANRIIPDLVRSLNAGTPLLLRNPHAIRAWQHVSDPLSCYIALAQAQSSSYCTTTCVEVFSQSFDFGSSIEDHSTVQHLIAYASLVCQSS